MSGGISGSNLKVLVVIRVAALPAASQSFSVQCSTSAINGPDSNGLGANAHEVEPACSDPTALALWPEGFLEQSGATGNRAINCQPISGGFGFATMADRTHGQ